MKRIISFFIFICLVLFNAQVLSWAKGKISPFGKILIHEYENQQNNKLTVKGDLILSEKLHNEETGAIIKVNDQIDESKFVGLHVTVQIKAGNIWTVRTPIKNINKLSEISGVEYIHVDEPAFSTLDNVRIQVKADQVHDSKVNKTPYKGKNVIVGIIDNGFDFLHPTFLSNNNKLRIKKVWNQGVTSGKHPKNFDYGNEISTESEIISYTKDMNGMSHGTHVAGIAAGSGGSTNKYIGIAPESDIVLVSQKLNSDHTSSTGHSDILNGVKYIFDCADETGKPAVVNISLGVNFGPHDGSSLFDAGLRELVGKGRVVVGAAGNNGDTKMHIAKNFTYDDSLMKTFIYYQTYNGNLLDAYIDIWGDYGSEFETKVYFWNRSKNKFYEGKGFFSTKTDSLIIEDVITESGRYSTVYYTLSKSEFNGKPRTMLRIKNQSYEVLTILAVKAKFGKVNIWNCGAGGSSGSLFSSENVSTYVNGDNNSTITEIGGTSNDIITVGAYTSRLSFTNINNVIQTRDYKNAQECKLAPFSSIGPRVDNKIKPDITAPGLVVLSSVSIFDMNYSYTGDYYKDVVKFEGGTSKYSYAAMEGTSMAAPVVTGTVALMLCANPDLTSEEIKKILRETADNDACTEDIPISGNKYWGWGKVNTMAAVLHAASMAKPSVIKDGLLLYPNPILDILKIKFTADAATVHKFEVYDPLGRLIASNEFTAKVGENNIEMQLTDISTGLYYLTVFAQGNLKTSIFTKTKF